MAAIAVSYVIYLTDPVRVNQLQTQYPTGVQVPPNVAALTYGVPGPTQGTNNLDKTGGIAVFPNDSVAFSVDLSGAYGTQTFTLVIPDRNPPPAGFPDPYPLTLSCYWVGFFSLIGQPGVTQSSSAIRYIGPRRWVCGFEIPQLGEGGSGNAGTREARAASRTPDGMGFAFRSQSIATPVRTQTQPSGRVYTWERFYMRVNVQPSGGDDNFWAGKGTGEAGSSAILNLNTNGTVSGYNLANAVYPGALIGSTSALTIGTWYRIDVFVQWLAPPSGGSTLYMAVYVNGTLSFSGFGSNSASGQNATTSNLGQVEGTTAHGSEIDFDDWIGADQSDPNNGITFGAFPGMDLSTGSHVVLVRPTGFGPLHNTASWIGTGTAVAGDWREVNNMPSNGAGATTGLTTTVAATLQVTTDYKRQQFGPAAVNVSALIYTGTGSAGTIGFNTTSVSQNEITSTWMNGSLIYNVSVGASLDALADIGPVTLKVTTPAGTTAIIGLFASVEFIGYFGTEDNPPAQSGLASTLRMTIHNAPYPNLAQQNSYTSPLGAVRVSAGTYTGNNIGQDVITKIAANWWFVRKIGGSGNGSVWWSPMEAAHDLLNEVLRPELQTEAIADYVNPGKMLVGGSRVDGNTSGAVYQYVAVSDLTMRFLMGGAISKKSSLASSVNNFFDASFKPDAMFFYIDSYSASVTGHYYKGPGHTSDNASPLDAAQASTATFTTGSFTSETAIHNDTAQTAYMAWRKSDGSGQAQWFDVTSYTGNGGGSQNITLALNGFAPLFALVVPHNGVSYFRDPSHVGANSSVINGGLSTTAITAGAVNQLTVGTTLNANGIVYDVFVIGGSTTAWQNAVFTPAGEVQRSGLWAANPAPVAINPVTINIPTQWRIHRFDIRPDTEEHD